MIDSRFAGVRHAVADSWLGSAAAFAARAVSAAWAESWLAQWLAAFRQSVASVPLTGRVRFAAMVVVWAGLGYLGLLTVIPAYVAPGLPRDGIGFVIAAALVVAVLPDAFAQAWPGSALRRLVQKREL